LCELVDLTALNKRAIESMVRAGACDAFGNRAQLLAAIDGAVEAGQRAARDRESGQAGLFGAMFADDEEAPDPPLPDLPDLPQRERLQGEKEMLGFYVTGHPLEAYRDKISELRTHTTQTLEGLDKHTEVKLCGILLGVNRRRTKEGKLWASLQIEDLDGNVDAMVFNSVYETLLPNLVEDRAMLIKAKVMPEEGGPPKLSVQDLIPLDQARVDLPSLIAIRVRLAPASTAPNGASEKVEQLAELFARKPGEAQVRFQLDRPRDFSVTLDVRARVRPDKEFAAEVTRICGAESLQVLGG
jgi:DNA polymerase-3 subunit alpha